MELNGWLDKKVHIILTNNFSYIGIVIDCDENSITIIDKNNHRVQFRDNQIITIKEVEE